MLSNTCKYAVRAVIYLSLHATKEKKIGIKEVADELIIPAPFLGKILQTLARYKVLHSTKGPNGGFSLARPAVDLTLMDIVEIIDGTEIFDTCLIRTCNCSDTEPCSIHESITSLRTELKEFFMNQTINDLASEFRRDSDKIKI